MSGPPRDRTEAVDPDDRRAAYYAAYDTYGDPDPDPEWDALRQDAYHRRVAAERGRRHRRRLAVTGVLLVVLASVVLGIGWCYVQLDPRGGPGAPVTVTIEEGWGTDEVASALAAADVIGSAGVFKVYAALTGAGPFTPGTYALRTNLGVRDARNALGLGPPVVVAEDLTLLLPPGLTLGQIADRVAQLPGRSRDTFLQIVTAGSVRSKYMPAGVSSAEGFLFPDTYRIGADEDEGDIARKLVARFDQIADRAGLASSSATNGLTPYETVVAASLIQTEAKVAEDAPLISAVIRNRLNEGMPLQIDSTLCYAKGGCPPVPTNADKAIDSPYNTYKIRGLPPTPIASVTEANLVAAIRPAAVPYRYYVLADASGRHAFATTLAEHNANVATARAKGLL